MDLSVVIPLYNKENEIDRAIKSVLNQTISPKEIIVIDDGSKDRSRQVAEKIQDARLRVISQPNAGECGARNRGIIEAQYPLIGFLDADDEWKPDFLERIESLILDFPTAGAFATSAQIQKPDGTITYPKLGNLPSEPWSGLTPNFFELFQHGYAFNASSIVIPKKILKEVGMFPEGIKISGDVACWVNIAIRYPIAFVSSPSVIYHQEAQNRVGNIYKPVNEMPYIQPILTALETGKLPLSMKDEALEFIAQKQIMVAVENIMSGNPGYARKLLNSVRRTSKYRQDWLKWRFWASFPPKWPTKILTIKQLLTKKEGS